MGLESHSQASIFHLKSVRVKNIPRSREIGLLKGTYLFVKLRCKKNCEGEGVRLSQTREFSSLLLFLQQNFKEVCAFYGSIQSSLPSQFFKKKI